MFCRELIINLWGPGKRLFPGGSPAGYPVCKFYVCVFFEVKSKGFAEDVLPPGDFRRFWSSIALIHNH